MDHSGDGDFFYFLFCEMIECRDDSSCADHGYNSADSDSYRAAGIDEADRKGNDDGGEIKKIFSETHVLSAALAENSCQAVGRVWAFSAVLQQSFRFAVFPKQYITFNPMQYIKLRYQTDEVDLFSDEDMDGNVQPISREDYERLLAYLQKKNPAAILPIQIAYYAGLRIGEACGLAWQPRFLRCATRKDGYGENRRAAAPRAHCP